MGRAPPPPRGSAVYRSSNLPLTAMLSGLLGDNGGWETKVKGCLGACPPPSFVYFHCFDTGARFGCRTMLHLGRTCVNPYSRPISTLFPSVSFDNPLGRERERERESVCDHSEKIDGLSSVHVTIIFPTGIDNLLPVCGRRIAYRRFFNMVETCRPRFDDEFLSKLIINVKITARRHLDE